MAFNVLLKTEDKIRFKTIGTFPTYYLAYSFVGDDAQERTDYWWNGDAMQNGFGKEKFFKLGSMELNADEFKYKIVEVK